MWLQCYLGDEATIIIDDVATVPRIGELISIGSGHGIWKVTNVIWCTTRQGESDRTTLSEGVSLRLERP